MKDEKIILSQYDSTWPSKFEEEKDFLVSVIGQYLYGTIEHIGSTSVPGLTAKPVIDIMFGVESLIISQPAIRIINENGYCYFPYKKEIMHWFCKPSPKFRTHHLHLVSYKSDLWQKRVKFRDILRSDNNVAQEYAKLKQELALKYKNDRDKYTNAKTVFIEEALRK